VLLLTTDYRYTMWFVPGYMEATNGCDQLNGNYLTGEWEVDIPGRVATSHSHQLSASWPFNRHMCAVVRAYDLVVPLHRNDSVA
jgi:hypothetical protein